MSVVLITGCSSGFGLEAALAFAANGDTTCASMRNPAKADALRKRAADAGLEVDVVSLDVTDDASVAAAVADVEGRHGPVDVLVNNAGVDYDGSIETIDLDRARRLIETNVWGAVRMIRAVLPAMRARRSGVIINVSSVAGRVPGTLFNGFYGASKAALGNLSEALYGELGPCGIRVVLIEPGFFKTEIMVNDTGVMAADDPYRADAEWMAEFYDKSVEVGGDPVVVAEAIVKAAIDPSTPLHNLIGDDAHMFVDLVAQSGTVEAWLPVGISIVESVAGPRPAPPAAG